MWKDEIVEEVRATREKLLAEHGPDLESFVRWLREQENQRSDTERASLPPRKPSPTSDSAA
jgi:hypothetical protein